MKKFNPSKKIIIAIIIVIIIVFLVSFSTNKREQAKDTGVLQSLVSDVVGVVDKGVSFPLRALENGVRSVANLFSTYDENERLKRRIDEFAALQNDKQNLEKENKDLKKQLQLNATISNYETISASVINRSPDTWQNILIIDRGKKDGIEANMPVMGSSGLIGRVIAANLSSAKVELLTSVNQNANHFPVMIAPNGGEHIFGLMEEYDEDEEAFVVTQLTSVEKLKEGDAVSTSGLGGGSPKGLYIGKVKKIKPTSFGLDQEVYVTPASSMYDISVVTVVKRMVSDADALAIEQQTAEEGNEQE